MSNVTCFEAGPLDQWQQWSFKHPLLSKPAAGKLFLGEKLSLTGMEISLNTLPPERSMPFYHRHRHHEEVYIVLSGTGQFQVDGEHFEVNEGSTLRIAPAGERTWRNTGSTPLLYLVIQATEGSLKEHEIEDGEVTSTRVVW